MRTSRHCNRLPALPGRLTPQATVPAFIANSEVPARSALPDSKVVSRMASDMQEARYREGGLTRDGMELLGYTKAQIDKFASAARQLADQRAIVT